MRITIKRWGNSAGMVIPNIVMKELNLQPGQSVEAQVSNNQLILTPISGATRLMNCWHSVT